MPRILLVALITLAFAPIGLAAPDPGLVAHWDFSEGAGDLLHDRSGNNNHGAIRGAEWVRNGPGFALRFDGVDDFVDCGNDPSLDLRRTVTVMLWVRSQTTSSPERGIIMKGNFEAYGITDNNLSAIWYISSGRNYCGAASLTPDIWQHLAATYDGAAMRLYLDGKLTKSRDVTEPIGAGSNLLIGKRRAGNACFKGMLDEVRVYDRALSAEAIKARYNEEAKGMMETRPLLKEGPELSGKGFRVRLGARGGLQVEVGGDVYFVESSFSYPGKAMGRNHLSEADFPSEPKWKPGVRATGMEALEVTAVGSLYSLVRRIIPQGHRIRIADTLTNHSGADMGIIVVNTLIASGEATGCLRNGTPDSPGSLAQNPTVLLSQDSSQLGLLAEDDISRIQFESWALANQANVRLSHFALQPGKSHTLEWALYPMGRDADYWTFINRVRRDWGANFTILGPHRSFNVTRPKYWELFNNPQKLAAYLKRTRPKILATTPWLDYEHYNHLTGKLTTRKEYIEIMRKVKAAVQRIDPAVKVIGSIERPLVTLPRELTEALHKTMKGQPGGVREFTPPQMQIMEQFAPAWRQWRDSLATTVAGRPRYELYYRQKLPIIALAVYDKVGNGHWEFLREQARFIIEEVGLDGFYIDSCTGYERSPSSYMSWSDDQWDGVTVDIDTSTGKITRRYTDTVLVGHETRRRLFEYVLSRGKVIVANGHPVSRGLQALKTFRFCEAEFAYNAHAWKLGEKPPLSARLCLGNVSSPIGLGVRVSRLGDYGRQNYAMVVMKTAIAYLRHGTLYYTKASCEIPETGPGSGEYGPTIHMFPITPVRLGEGFVEGEERVVTCVSRTFRRPWKDRPKVLLFDVTGRRKTHDMKPVRSGNGWTVKVDLADWQEIAVIEQ